MSVQAILAPVFAQVFLAFFLLVWMGRARFAAGRAGQVTKTNGSPRTFGWPDKTRQIADCFHNQLELPILFYALVPLAMLTRKTDLVFVLLSWVFVATRYLHAFEHTGANRLKWRFPLFLAGALTLMAMWIYVAIRVLAAL